MKKFIKLLLFTVVAITLIYSSIKIERSIAEESYPFEAIIVSNDGLVVNEEANYSTFVTELAYGTRFNVIGKVGKMYKIQYNGGKEGYVSSSSGVVQRISDHILTTDYPGIETYNDYCNSLMQLGFPASYCPYLYNLHSKHPLWVFKPDMIGVTLDEASKQEEGKCSLNTENQNFIIGWNESNYYFVHSKVISSYMDPRNGLFENTVFQFFDSDDNKDISSDETLSSLVGEGNLKQYLEVFKQAASQNGINVVDLVARSKNEGSNTIGYDSVSGIYTTKYNLFYEGNSLDGFYNFYNIGSYGSNAIMNGLVYAAGYFNPEVTSFQRPWNSPEKAIVGGADFLTSSYIKQGQDTPYYRKFNVSSYTKGTKYTHQYMTAVYAPISEGKDMYSTFKNNNYLDKEFIFTIPVYENMGDKAYQAVDRSIDSSLSSITINDQPLAGFDKDVIEYYVNVPTDNEGVVVNAVASNGGALVEGTGTITFVDGVAIAYIKVSAEDRSKTTTYVINIKKVSGDTNITVDQVLSNVDVRVYDTVMYGISPSTNASTIINTITKNGGNVVIKNIAGEVKTSGNLATGDSIMISGTSDSKTYTVSVRGDTSGDGLVKINDLILVQSQILKKIELENYKFYSADLSQDGAVKINDLVMIQSYILGKINI